MSSQVVDGFVRSRIPLFLWATALALLAASISPARDAVWLLPYIDFRGVAAVITFLWWVRTVSCVYAVVLVLIALFPVRVVVALGHVAVRVAAFCSPAVARRVERREFARKYQLAQRGQR